MGYSSSYAMERSNYRNGNAKGSYGYNRGLSGRLSYSLVMPKTYGTDVNLDSYLGRNTRGLAGYVKNLIKYSLGSLKAPYLYPLQKRERLYKVQDMMRNYELKMNRSSSKLGLIIPDFPMYDLSSMRRPVINLEARLN